MSTVITPFQGTDPFSTATFNNRISQINTGFSYISNPNLLDNWYFGNPVDQRGGYVVPPNIDYNNLDWSGVVGITDKYYPVKRWKQYSNLDAIIEVDGTEYVVAGQHAVRGYTGAGYGIDRWILQAVTSCSMLVGDGYITLYAKNNDGLLQKFPAERFSIGDTITVSVLTDTGLLSKTITLTESVQAYPYDNSIWNMAAGKSNGIWIIYALITYNQSTEQAINIKAAKLELGSQQTLAHQDADGNWVLNEIPDYGEQLRRCQRYFVNFNPYKMPWFAMPPAVASNTYHAYSAVTLPVAMRAQPVVAYRGNIVLSQDADHAVTSISVSDNTFTGNSIQLKYEEETGSLTANSLYRVQGSNDPTSYIWLSADL